jgi:tRNA threonylcarbamoyladenosine biosynthesis protein TsaB
MRVLAIDTALEACSAAVLDTERGGILASESIPMLRGHAEALLPLVSRVMSEAGLEFGALDRIAVTVGPGSFTGLRVGVSAARGIAVAAGKPAVGLTTLAAFAAPYIAIDDVTPLVAAIDARNDQVYMQMVGAGGRSLIQPRLASLREAVRDAANARARLVGSAAAMVAAAWPAGVQPPPVVDAARAPIIDWVAHLGAAAAQALSLPKPLYLRAPDAQPQDAAHLPRR